MVAPDEQTRNHQNYSVNLEGGRECLDQVSRWWLLRHFTLNNKRRCQEKVRGWVNRRHPQGTMNVCFKKSFHGNPSNYSCGENMVFGPNNRFWIHRGFIFGKLFSILWCWIDWEKLLTWNTINLYLDWQVSQPMILNNGGCHLHPPSATSQLFPFCQKFRFFFGFSNCQDGSKRWS